MLIFFDARKEDMKVYPRSGSINNRPENDYVINDPVGRIIPNVDNKNSHFCYIFGEDPVCLFVFRDKSEKIVKCVLRLQHVVNEQEGIYDDYYCSFNLIDKKTGQFVSDLDLILNEFQIIQSKLVSIGYELVYDDLTEKLFRQATYNASIRPVKYLLDLKFMSKLKKSKKQQNLAFVPFLLERRYYFSMSMYTEGIAIFSLNDSKFDKDYYVNYEVYRDETLSVESFAGLASLFSKLMEKEIDVDIIKQKRKTRNA